MRVLSKKPFVFGLPAHHLTDVCLVCQDGPYGRGVLIKGLSPVIAFVVIGIVLIDVGYGVKDFAFSKDFCHEYIHCSILLQ